MLRLKMSVRLKIQQRFRFCLLFRRMCLRNPEKWLNFKALRNVWMRNGTGELFEGERDASASPSFHTLFEFFMIKLHLGGEKWRRKNLTFAVIGRLREQSFFSLQRLLMTLINFLDLSGFFKFFESVAGIKQRRQTFD